MGVQIVSDGFSDFFEGVIDRIVVRRFVVFRIMARLHRLGRKIFGQQRNMWRSIRQSSPESIQ